ncbi:MAG: hypothetical protein ACKON7_09830 [Planctomycetaceae bacterium]
MATDQDPGGTVVHEVRWAEALPWWLLFRAAGAAFSPTVILLAALGALATWGGWSAADQLGLAGVDPAADAIAAAKGDDLALTLPAGSAGAGDALLPSRRAVPWLVGLVDRLPPVAADVARLVTVPFRPSASLRQVGGALARIGWFVLVWSIFGTAITRHVALKLVGEDAPGVVGATLFGSRKWTSAFNSVLFVLAGIAALSIPGAILGLVMRTGWGLAAAGAVWPLVLLGAVILAILAVGLVAGWPLMVAAVGVERGDSFQAISTAFSYLYQRPLHYAFYSAVALVVALPALAAAGVFADLTGTFAMWAASFGMGHERTAEVLEGLTKAGPAAGAWGVRAIGFWTRGLEWLLSSFGWGYFWSIATAAYLVLRRDVDGTELDEVVIDEPGEAAA